MAKNTKRRIPPAQVQQEYRQGVEYKRQLGAHGMAEQSRINERFYSGDQWYGVNCGDSRPLVRHNVIKRIGDYKMAVVGAAPVSVRYSAEGVADTPAIREQVEGYRRALCRGDKATAPTAAAVKTQAAARALTDYFQTTAKRLKLDYLKQRVLRNAYIAGTGVLYTYWNDSAGTGQYADDACTAPIRGDMAAEVLEIEQVYMGDVTVEDIQQQPYVLIAQRQPVSRIQALAKRHGCRDWESIRGDEASGRNGHATLLTRFWKEVGEDGICTVRAMQVCGDTAVREAWNMGLRLYPLAMFRWEEKRHCCYGESEIPHLIPNQIAINRTVSAGVWAVMMMGMPIMLVNGDVVTQPITNDPGQIIPVYGSADELREAVRYVDPPAFSAQLDANVQSLISDTMTQAGVSSTLLGDVKPNNTSAIIAVREASLMPLQMMQNRFYTFIEEVARIWAEFWLTMYGSRGLRIEEEQGVWYMPFDGAQYRALLPELRVDVGSGDAYSETRVTETLDNLYKNGIITAKQYLSRLPSGAVPRLDSLLQELA
ncbi:MAG: hypothetical protein IJ518_00250 [Clostridia bacterium]|nr:hypothetical protein [Clostridia bacterium]